MGFVILSIYPTATSTNVAIFADDAEIKRAELRFGLSGITEMGQAGGQLHAAEDTITEWLGSTSPPDAVVGVAFPRSRLPAGLYVIDDFFEKHLCGDFTFARNINRSVTLTAGIARRYSALPLAFVSVSNRDVDAIYKISGIRGMTFNGVSRMIQIREAIRVVCGEMGLSPGKCSMIAAYLGNGFAVCSQSEGRVRDFSDSLERGAFSARHTGSVPATSIVRMAYSGIWSKADLLKNVYESGGLSSYFPNAGLSEVISMMRDGDAFASMALRAMTGQLAAELSAHAAALYGRVDAFVLLGEYAMNGFFVSLLKDKISWICDKIIVHDGEDALNIIAGAALEFLRGGGTFVKIKGT